MYCSGGKISFFGAYAVYDENGIFRDWCVWRFTDADCA